MKRTITLIILWVCLPGMSRVFAGPIWQLVPARMVYNPSPQRAAGKSLIYKADEDALRLSLSAAAKGNGGRIVDLPMPDGTLHSFRVETTPLLPPALAAKYPELQTYTGVALDNAFVTAKLDFTVYGFHAMVYDGDNTSFIDPTGDEGEGYYSVHYKRDEVSVGGISACQSAGVSNVAASLHKATDAKQRLANGYELRRYRLALSCSHQYAQKVTGSAAPTKAAVLSKMTTTMNRVNGVYERELSVTMSFVDKEDTLIHTVAAGDPFGPYNSSASSLISQNQKICDTLIGNANYDIGHAFSTGAGGLSSVGVVCKTGSKAQCVTGSENPMGDGFDIDYVVHEMGHEYGADHTFNNNQSVGCGGNAVAVNAYEPGSGSTIMAYAGLCTGDNLQGNSDAYFHAASLRQIQNYITHDGNACAIKSTTGNMLPGVGEFTASYNIPCRTPFELTAPAAIDSAGGSVITYCWEQWNLGSFGQTLAATTVAGPLFRSYDPVQSPTRIFPNLKMVRSGVLSNAGIDKASGEKIPEVARFLTFRLAMRSLKGSYGTFNLPDDSVHINVINTGSTGFTVTSQDAANVGYEGLSSQKITWNVAGTADAPVSAANVDIYLSPDSGSTWPYFLGSFPNNGSATVTFPNPAANIEAGRIKVKGANNVFFNINSKDFKVVRNFSSSVQLYPVPASNILHVVSDNTTPVKAVVYNTAGRLQWQGELGPAEDLPVYLWARGVYIMKLVDNSGRRSIKKFVVQ